MSSDEGTAQAGDVAGSAVGSRAVASSKRAARPPFKMPSVLEELGLRVVDRGIVLPEPSRTLKQRRRDLLRLMPPDPAFPKEDADGEKGKGKGKRKQRAPRKLGTLLDREESTLFHGAHTGEVEFCEEAIRSEVNVNVRSNADIDGIGTGATALHIAAARGHDDVAVLLLRSGADPNIASGRGELPIQLATKAGHIGVVRVLSAVSTPAHHMEGTAQLLQSGPRWDSDRKKRKLHAALQSLPAPPSATVARRTLAVRPKWRPVRRTCKEEEEEPSHTCETPRQQSQVVCEVPGQQSESRGGTFALPPPPPRDVERVKEEEQEAEGSRSCETHRSQSQFRRRAFAAPGNVESAKGSGRGEPNSAAPSWQSSSGAWQEERHVAQSSGTEYGNRYRARDGEVELREEAPWSRANVAARSKTDSGRLRVVRILRPVPARPRAEGGAGPPRPQAGADWKRRTLCPPTQPQPLPPPPLPADVERPPAVQPKWGPARRVCKEEPVDTSDASRCQPQTRRRVFTAPASVDVVKEEVAHSSEPPRQQPQTRRRAFAAPAGEEDSKGFTSQKPSWAEAPWKSSSYGEWQEGYSKAQNGQADHGWDYHGGRDDRSDWSWWKGSSRSNM